MSKLSKEIEELKEVVRMINSDDFKKYFSNPMRDKMDSKAIEFFAKDLKENWRTGGQVEGLNEFFEIIKSIKNDLKNKQFEFENLPEDEQASS